MGTCTRCYGKTQTDVCLTCLTELSNEDLLRVYLSSEKPLPKAWSPGDCSRWLLRTRHLLKLRDAGLLFCKWFSESSWFFRWASHKFYRDIQKSIKKAVDDIGYGERLSREAQGVGREQVR